MARRNKNSSDENQEITKNTQKFNLKSFLIVFAIFVGIFSIIFFAVRQNKEIEVKNAEKVTMDELMAKTEPPKDIKKCERLKYWSVTLEDFGSYARSLRTMDRVFARMNYEFVNASLGDDWDILWALETPYGEQADYPIFCNVKGGNFLPHQKINHFPGVAALVSKSYMNEINRQFNFTLPSFILPDDQELFDKFIKENPHKKLLEKNFYNRGVKIIKVKDIDVTKNETFYQEFMDNPFLIDGHAFDFGVFVLITSFDPLRVYRFNEEVLLRFCTAKYHPFDPKNRNKYVVRDGSIPVYEMPSFSELFSNYSFSSKVMFENHIKNLKFNVESLWTKIDRAIAQVVVNAGGKVRRKLEKLKMSNHHFFELVRFDIILDKNLNPFVVEVNMSPNLTPADERYERNALIYEQLIHNVVKMIGGGSYHEFYSRFDPTSTIVSNRKNLATSLTKCLKYDCINNCNRTRCQMCHPCMTDEVRYQLSEAFREHQHAANFKRVFPVSDHFNDENLIEQMSRINQIQMRWWKGKCEDDARWC